MLVKRLLHSCSLVELVGFGILNNRVDGSNGSQKHDSHKHNDVDDIGPEVNAGLLWLHDYQPDDTWHPEGHGGKPKGPKESEQICTDQVQSKNGCRNSIQEGLHQCTCLTVFLSGIGFRNTGHRDYSRHDSQALAMSQPCVSCSCEFMHCNLTIKQNDAG